VLCAVWCVLCRGVSEVQSRFALLHEGVADISRRYTEAEVMVTLANERRGQILFFGLITPMGLLALSVLGAVLPVRPKDYLAIIFLLTSLVQFFVWISFALHYPLSIVVRDGCDYVEAFLSRPDSTHHCTRLTSRTHLLFSA
jgi:hypothetical protein